jgi:hypothetical protein
VLHHLPLLHHQQPLPHHPHRRHRDARAERSASRSSRASRVEGTADPHPGRHARLAVVVIREEELLLPVPRASSVPPISVTTVLHRG